MARTSSLEQPDPNVDAIPGLRRAIYTLGRKMGRSGVHQRRSGVDAAISGAG
jgi:hypothetical protein